MATTVDELVIKIAMDATGLNVQMQQAGKTIQQFRQNAAVAATDAEKSAQKMVDGFSRVTKEILGVGAAILGVNGLKDLAVNLTQVASATERMAQAFELDPEMLNKWQGFLEAVGKQDFGATSASLGTLTRALQEYRTTLRGPFAEALPYLNRLGITGADLTAPGRVSDILNSVLLKIGANVNRPENADAKAFLLGHLPGMTVPMMTALMTAPTQAVLDRYQTATKGQMEAAERIRQSFVEAAQEIRRTLNPFLEKQESAATLIPDIITGKQKIVPPGAGRVNPISILMDELPSRTDTGLGGAIKPWLEWLQEPHASTFHRKNTGGIPLPMPRRPLPSESSVMVHPLDTSTMPTMPRHTGYHRGGNVTTNNFTTNISGVKTNNPQAWADEFYSSVSNHFKTLPPQANGGGM
jgi:gas vesicle protein